VQPGKNARKWIFLSPPSEHYHRERNHQGKTNQPTSFRFPHHEDCAEHKEPSGAENDLNDW
jgi:hypothetical protein